MLFCTIFPIVVVVMVKDGKNPLHHLLLNLLSAGRLPKALISVSSQLLFQYSLTFSLSVVSLFLGTLARNHSYVCL